MGFKVKKTEHCGAKHGQGAFWGPKKVAKAGSKRVRRENGKREIWAEIDRLPDPDRLEPLRRKPFPGN